MPDLAKKVGAAFRDRDKLVSGVARHLLKGQDNGRRADCIHPSEIAHEHWCPRATYYRITGVEGLPDVHSLAMEMVFERGHDSHDKWQRWFWEMGILRGMWRCYGCDLYWEATSPRFCPRCEAGENLLRYGEVPVENKEYLLAGQADGDVLNVDRWKLIEVKTIGPGTVRYEAPALITKYSYEHVDDQGKTHRGIDWYALWSGIRRPFPAHLRQGMIYCFCAERSEIVFIYDPKFLTAPPKEFEVKFREDIIEDVLEECVTVRSALEKGRPPKRPMWAEQTHKVCANCSFRNTCWPP